MFIAGVKTIPDDNCNNVKLLRPTNFKTGPLLRPHISCLNQLIQYNY